LLARADEVIERGEARSLLGGAAAACTGRRMIE